MKKFFFAVMCCLAVTAVFTACSNDNGLMQADPETQPIAGKTYICTDSQEGGYLQFTFKTDYKCIIEVQANKDAVVVKKDLFTWYMSPSDKEVTIRYAQDTRDANTGKSLSNKLLYSGTYDAAKNTVTLTDATDPQLIYVCVEKK